MTRLLLINYMRSRGPMAGLLILFLAGLLSLNIGKHFLEKDRQILEQTTHYQQENIGRHANYIPDDIGLLLYYIRFGLANKASNLAGLSIGQRDINPVVQSVNIRNLEEQKYSGRLMNPLYQLLGNMDFSFVLIYFFPLIIIAISFDLLSAEKEAGTWNLVKSQSTNPRAVLRTKMGIRYLSVLLVLSLLLVIAKLYLQIPLSSGFATYTLISILYVSFWFGLSWLMASFDLSSSQNALYLLVCWVMITIIVPATVNAVVVNLYPIPEAFGTMVESREGYHTKWDQAKEPSIQKFQAHYPQFSQYKHPEGKDFSWLWYYAIQQLGDDESAEKSAILKQQMKKRSAFSQAIGQFVPSIHTQLSLNALSHSDMENYLNFLEALENFHEEKRLYFYPKIFQNISNEDWTSFQLQYFEDQTESNWFFTLSPLILFCLLCAVWGEINFRRDPQ